MPEVVRKPVWKRKHYLECLPLEIPKISALPEKSLKTNISIGPIDTLTKPFKKDQVIPRPKSLKTNISVGPNETLTSDSNSTTSKTLTPGLELLMQLVCSWSGIDYPAECTPPDSNCVLAAEEAIELARKRVLARSQRERVQIVALVECVRRCFPGGIPEITYNLSPILIALASVVTGTAKNHQGNDVISGLALINNKSTFLEHFGSYSQADNWIESLPRGALKDVFGEFTWTKMKKDNFARSEMRIEASSKALSALNYPVQIDEVVRVLRKDTPPIVGGKLTIFFSIAAFTLLGLIHRDKTWQEWAPSNFTAGSGCVNWLKKATGQSMLDGDGVKKLLRSMLQFLPENITFLDLENIACKAQVLKFDGRPQSREGSADSKKRKRMCA